MFVHDCCVLLCVLDVVRCCHCWLLLNVFIVVVVRLMLPSLCVGVLFLSCVVGVVCCCCLSLLLLLLLFALFNVARCCLFACCLLGFGDYDVVCVLLLLSVCLMRGAR